MEEAADQNRPESISKDQLIKLQREDPTLALVRRQADQTINGYTWKNGVLVKLKDLVLTASFCSTSTMQVGSVEDGTLQPNSRPLRQKNDFGETATTFPLAGNP